MDQLSLRNNQFEVQDFMKLADHFRGNHKTPLKWVKKKPEKTQPMNGENRLLVTNELVEFED